LFLSIPLALFLRKPKAGATAAQSGGH
jgi:hypothetical protein